MSLQPAAAHEPESRCATLVNWLALAALLALGFFAAPARAATPASGARVPPGAALRL
jgi:hypothetical protein